MKKLDWGFVLGVSFLLFLGLLALLAPIISPYQAWEVHWTNVAISPNTQFLFGTDALGRDILSRTLQGLRLSYFIAMIVAMSSILIGSIIGIISGYFGGKIDHFTVWLIDCFLAFPTLLLTIAISVSLGPGMKTLFISLIASSWASTARIVRSHVKQLRSKDFIVATRALGAGHTRTIFHHILPHCVAIIIVLLILSTGTAILAETSLSFLGFGLKPPYPSLGRLIYDGASYLRIAPWWPLIPGLMIAWTIITINLLGDSLRKRLKIEFTL